MTKQMKKKIFYWSPCLNNIGTIKSTINSALSLTKYDQKNEVYIINACGEWNDHQKLFQAQMHVTHTSQHLKREAGMDPDGSWKGIK